MSDDRFNLIMTGGAVAQAAGRPIDENPYAAWTPEWLCWRHGHRGLPSAGRNKFGAASRETRAGKGGRSILGPRREWSADELAALEACAGTGMSEPLIAEVMGRSYAAVRVKLCRQRKAAA